MSSLKEQDLVRLIEKSGLFDKNWYVKEYQDVAILRYDPIKHYLKYGSILKRNPSLKFNTKLYIDSNSEVAESGLNPLVHHILTNPKSDSCNHPDSHNYEFDDNLLLIKSSKLFNRRWYLAEYRDVARKQVDPAVHYLKNGGREGRNPSPWFNTLWYLAEYRDMCCSDMNPLVHYLRYGQWQGCLPMPPVDDILSPPWWFSFAADLRTRIMENGQEEQNQLKVLNALARMAKNPFPVVIIIPVYNAPGEVDECLQSLLAHTKNCRIIVINDASPDPKIYDLLARYKGVGPIEIYHNEKNLGFTRTVNRGIELAGEADVVFLNSDTKVTPAWLRNLRIAAYSQDKIGTVTPLSNNAGAFSVPEIGKANPIPESLSLDEYARAITQSSLRAYPIVPTGNGFCLYVRRDCLLETGRLDAEAFPRGYGEENDFCMRAGQLGWTHVIDDATFVYHVRSASFGEAKNELVVKGRAVINTRYPEYTKAIQVFSSGLKLKAVRERTRNAAEIITSGSHSVKSRILYVLSTKTGGTPQTNQDLMTALEDEIESFVLYCNSLTLTLTHFRNGIYVEMEMHILQEPIKAFPHHSDEYNTVVANWLVQYSIELVHIRHIAWHGLGLVDVSKSLGLPVVFSFHDFYTICPTVKLLDENYQYCHGECTPSRGQCKHELWQDASFPAIKNEAIHVWKRSSDEFLRKCDIFVTTSKSAREILERNFPFLKDRSFHVIPHGRNFTKFLQITSLIKPNEKIRIVVPGNISKAKGAKIVTELGSAAIKFNMEIHVLGNVSKDLAGAKGIIFHGPYRRDEFTELIQKITPHIGCIFSIWPETYCHTLTELWSCGIPVIAFDYGAVGDRVRESGGGWLTSSPSIEAVLEIIQLIQSVPDEYKQKIDAVKNWQIAEGTTNNCQHMGQQYIHLYRNLS